MEIIPAITILDGHCVALYKGSYEQKITYRKTPMEMAHYFQKEGATVLHVVDLNSRQTNQFRQQNLIENLIKSVQIPVQLEASFSTIEQIDLAFKMEAAKVVIRPFAREIIQQAILKYGPAKIMVEIQAKGSDTIAGGETTPGEPIDVVDFAEKLVLLGVKQIIFTDERTEGTMINPNYDEVDRLFLTTGNDLKIFVSGGISTAKHLQLLKKIGASGAIIGKAFFEHILSYHQAIQSVK